MLLGLVFSSALAAGVHPSYPSSLHPTGTAPLRLVSEAGLAQGDMVTLETLQGAIARDTPEIYILQADPNSTLSADPYILWLNEMETNFGVHVDTSMLHNVTSLLAHYSKRISGYVVFDADTASSSVNAAITFCAAQPGVVVAASESATISTLNDLGVPQIRDLSKSTPSAVYKEFRGNLSHRIVSFQPPSKSKFVAGYAVFARAPTLEWEGSTGGHLAKQVLADMLAEGPLGVAFGWGPESKYVGTIAKYGAYVHASDYCRNLAVLSNVPAHARPTLPIDQKRQFSSSSGEHTVTFLVTDGDNLQWDLSVWATDSRWFASPLVGTIPLGFTTSPALVDLAPPMLDWTRRLATEKGNTSLVCGPSGAGYTYAGDLKGLDAFGNLTADLMRAAGMDQLNVIGFDDSLSLLSPLSGAASGGVFYYSFGAHYVGEKGSLRWMGSTPVIGGRYALWGTDTVKNEAYGVDGLVKALEKLPKDTSTSEGYSLIPVHAWSHTVADVADAIQKLRASGGFDIVTPEAFVAKIRKNIPPS